VFSAALNLLYLAPSLYMLNVYDRVMVSGGALTLIFLTLALLAALMSLSALDAIRGRLMVAANARLDRLLATDLLRFAMGEREPGFAQSRSQALRDFDQFRAAVTGAPAMAACDLPWAPLFLIICFIIHPAIGVLVLVGGILLALVAIAGEQASRSSIRRQVEATTSYALVESDAASAEAGRVLGMREALVKRQLSARQALVQAQAESAVAIGGYTAITKFLRQFLQSAVLGLGAWLAVQQQMSAGGIIAGSILAARAFSPIEQLVGAWRQLGTGLQAFNTIKAALAQSASAVERTVLPAPKGAIQLENVHVRAPTEGWILQNISLVITAGEIIGVVGPSGAGKTTLARVICGALRPSVGAVRIDGASLTDWDAEALGKYIGYVPQDTRLFAGTVAANIGRFRARADDPAHDEKVVAAAKAAGAHELILRLPKGYETVIQPNGAGLSAGQSQRIVLARALFGDPPLLVLDEPNSHLDAQGEAALVESLTAARARGATVIVVAHRAGFMSIADRILVVRDGKIERFEPRDQMAARLTQVAGGKTGAPGENRGGGEATP
jgi:ATP-binding cassette subfamily C protein